VESHAREGRRVTTLPAFEDAVDALTLSRATFPPIRWVIPGIIPTGATLLAAPEKSGKSWWALQLARAMSLQGSVLYLALEDTQESLHWRMGMQPGACLSTLTLVPQGGVLALPHGSQQILKWLSEAPDPILVIVDTLEKLRGDDKDGRQYRSDYKAVAQLKTVADKYGVALIFLHHLNQREAKADEEPGDIVYRVSGTSGITGAADTILVLQRERLSATGYLFATGRRIPSTLQPITWDEATFSWSLTAPDVPLASPVVALVQAKGPATRASICQELGLAAMRRIEDALVLGALVEDGDLLRLPAEPVTSPPHPSTDYPG
jgi:hypothetical protein